MASWAEDQERAQAYDELLREEPGFMPDPKPARRVKADLEAWTEMHRLVYGKPCQVCGVERGSMSLHHLVPRSQSGDDVIENLALLCGHGTVGCHGDVEARRNDARSRLGMSMTPDQVAYVVGKKGEAWLHKHYSALPGLEATEGMGSSDACC